jgi:ribokinase
MARVIVVGSMNMDIIATLQRMPRPGETLNGDSITFCPGGKGLNQAVAAAQLGARTLFAGRLGRDAMGDQVLEFMTGRGIDVSNIHRTDSSPTANALVMVDSSAENHIIVIPAANAEVCPADADAIAFKPGDLLVCQFEVPRPAIAAVFARARAAGARTLLNAAPALTDAPAALWAETDLLVVNETELSQLSGVAVPGDATIEDVAVAARRLIQRPDQTVIATLGVRGAVAVTSGEWITSPGRAVRAVDTTGAGDCFVGALSAALVAGQPLPMALRQANVAASIAVTRLGTGTAMPTAAEVAAALAE